MDIKDQIHSAQDLLSKILSFFPRIDSKGSVLLGIDIGMLAILAANAPSFDLFTEWYMYIPILPVTLISISVWHLYKSNFPKLDGGYQSMIYFKEIAGRTEAKYLEEFKNMSAEQYLKEILGQVWRNSQILKEKYHHIKYAFNFMALAIIPWAVSLTIFVTINHLPDSIFK